MHKILLAFFSALWYNCNMKAVFEQNAASSRALLRWRVSAILWPLLCVVFAGIILASRTGEERITDTVFTLLPLVFFAGGMSMRRRLLQERQYAGALTTAEVVSKGLRNRSGKRYFYPQYRFQAGGTTWNITSPRGYGLCPVEEGNQVALYYNPENPRQFYVPAVQRHDSRISVLLCGIGVVWPLLGLFAPQLRALFPFSG